MFVFTGYALVSQGLTSTQIDSIVVSSMSQMPHAGIAVAVIENGEIIHSAGYGVTSIVTQEKVDGNTLICNCIKQQIIYYSRTCYFG